MSEEVREQDVESDRHLVVFHTDLHWPGEDRTAVVGKVIRMIAEIGMPVFHQPSSMSSTFEKFESEIAPSEEEPISPNPFVAGMPLLVNTKNSLLAVSRAKTLICVQAAPPVT